MGCFAHDQIGDEIPFPPGWWCFPAEVPRHRAPLCLPGPARMDFWFLLHVLSRDAVGVVSTSKQSPQECGAS